MVFPGRHQTLQTSTTPVSSADVSGRYILIASSGDDHLVDFGESPGATMTSALVPKGATLMFNTEEFCEHDGTFKVSVRAVNSSGLVTIYTGAE
jgi:hypothetical protein